MKKYDWSDRENILCVRPDNMGDVLMTQPALRALKQDKKGRKITLLTSKMGAKIATKLPEVDEVIVFDVPWIKTNTIGNGSKAIQRLVKLIRMKRFDAAAIFTNYSQSAQPSAMICYLADIPRVLAYSRENPYHLINNWLPDKEPFEFPIHGVQRQLNMAEVTGAAAADKKMRLAVDHEEKSSALKKLEAKGVHTEKPWMLIHPGVSEDKREYPVRLYGKASELLAKEGYQIIITGLERENNLASGVEKASKAAGFNLAGKLSLDEFTALISEAPVIVTNNTASVHIAAAVGTPVVDLYARTNPEHTPWMVEHRTLYFDVPKNIQSSNTTLVHTTPDKNLPLPKPADIVRAVHELIEGLPLDKTEISSEKMNWTDERNSGTHTNLQSKRGPGRNPYKPLFSKIKGI